MSTLVLDDLPKTLVGTYQLEKRLAKGGMGEIWRAKHLRTQGIVAIKRLLTDRLVPEGYESPQYKELLQRFEQEAKGMVRLNHPNIVRVYDYDYDIDNKWPFLVMEYLPGKDLAELMAELKRPMTLEELLPIINQIGDALTAAHKNFIVHRDIKPENIRLVSYPAVGGERTVAMLLDFGIAKMRYREYESAFHPTGTPVPPSPTRTGEILGTPDYMSPEQAGGLNNKIDTRTDQWSLAVIIYEALTGHKPFRPPGGSDNAEGAQIVMARILSGTYTSFGKLAKEMNLKLPKPVVGAIEQAMNPDIEARFPTIQDFVLRLNSHMAAYERAPASSPTMAAVLLPEPLPPRAEVVPPPAPVPAARPPSLPLWVGSSLLLGILGGLLGARFLGPKVIPASPPTPALLGQPAGSPDLGTAPETRPRPVPPGPPAVVAPPPSDPAAAVGGEAGSRVPESPSKPGKKPARPKRPTGNPSRPSGPGSPDPAQPEPNPLDPGI